MTKQRRTARLTMMKQPASGARSGLIGPVSHSDGDAHMAPNQAPGLESFAAEARLCMEGCAMTTRSRGEIAKAGISEFLTMVSRGPELATGRREKRPRGSAREPHERSPPSPAERRPLHFIEPVAAGGRVEFAHAYSSMPSSP